MKDWKKFEEALLKTLYAWHIRGSLAKSFVNKVKHFCEN